MVNDVEKGSLKISSSTKPNTNDGNAEFDDMVGNNDTETEVAESDHDVNGTKSSSQLFVIHRGLFHSYSNDLIFFLISTSKNIIA